MKTEMLVCMDGVNNSNVEASSSGGRDGDGGDGEDVDGDGGEGSGSNNAAAKMVMVLGATNQPWELDDAFKRRFEKRIYIPLPGAPERSLLFRICLRNIRLDPSVDLAVLADATENYSGADIAVVCKHAAYAPMRHKQAEVARLYPRTDQMRDRILAIQSAEEEVKNAALAKGDFQEAIAANKPSASVSNLKKFEEYAAEHGAT
jgi:katanin p60 ATPase-containing subunit A1